MCLPSIIEVGDRNGIEFNPRTLNKKEVYAKCPFCGDGRYKLSLNAEYNVFKCWLCQAKGGVLEFESLLTGVPFNEVKAKYFGKNSKKYHPAEMLSPVQLRKIGWAEYKRHNRDDFKLKKEAVLQDWKEYEREESVKHFAMLMVIAHLENQNERQHDLLEYVVKSCQETGIKLLFSKLMEEYIKNDEDHSDWAIEATEIARSAWKVSIMTCDLDLEKVMLNTVIFYYLQKMYNQNTLKDSLNHKTS
jgi:hypothetical protein